MKDQPLSRQYSDESTQVSDYLSTSHAQKRLPPKQTDVLNELLSPTLWQSQILFHHQDEYLVRRESHLALLCVPFHSCSHSASFSLHLFPYLDTIIDGNTLFSHLLEAKLKEMTAHYCSNHRFWHLGPSSLLLSHFTHHLA